MRPSVYPSAHLSIRPPISLSIHPTVCPSVQTSVHLSIHPFSAFMGEFRLLLLLKCIVFFYHCPCPAALDLSSHVSILVLVINVDLCQIQNCLRICIDGVNGENGFPCFLHLASFKAKENRSGNGRRQIEEKYCQRAEI